ncbi:glutamate racemase, partial [Enterobacter hormaechei subsp. steigerwaltii]|nr:glutamate racemase [Enterobacter hormaechei subsp. steigerwaltii]
MENIGRQRPIGVFDSGIGGLTNVRALMERLPMENIIYFGDTARVPYGTKSKATIENFSMQIVDFLLEHDVKAMVIACNTIAAVAGQKIRQKTGNMPVLDVISA